MRSLHIDAVVVLLVAAVLAAAQWPPSDATVAFNGNPARTSFTSTPLGLTARPQVTFSGSSVGGVAGAEGLVYFESNGAVQTMALDNATLSAVHSLNAQYGLRGSVALTPNGVAVCAGCVFLIAWDGTVTDLTSTSCVTAPTPSWDGSLLYYADTKLARLVAINSQTGAQVWQAPKASSWSATDEMAIDAEGNLYFVPYLDFDNATDWFVKANGKTGEFINTTVLLPDNMGYDYPTLMIDTTRETLYAANASLLLAYTLNLELIWKVHSAHFDASLGYLTSLALNAQTDATLVYWVTQETLFALRSEDGSIAWNATFPTSTGLVDIVVMGNNTISLLDESGCIHVLDDSGHPLWSKPTGAAGAGELVAVGSALLVNTGTQVLGSFGYAEITSTNTLPVIGNNAITLYLSAFPSLGLIVDATWLSSSCQLISPSGQVAQTLQAQSYANNAPGYVACLPNGAPDASITAISVAFHYEDGTSYTTPTYNVAFIQLLSISPTTGPYEGGNTLTLTGLGFHSCNTPGVTCCAAFVQLRDTCLALTIASDTAATLVLPHSPTGGGIMPSLVNIQVQVNSTQQQTVYYWYQWDGTGSDGPPAWFWAAVIGGPIVLIGGIIAVVWFVKRRNKAASENVEKPLLGRGNKRYGEA